MTGLIRGSKHWNFKMMQELWDWLGPLIRSALDRVSSETRPDWIEAFGECSKARDPNRIHQLLEILMEDPVGSKSSIVGKILNLLYLKLLPVYCGLKLNCSDS